MLGFFLSRRERLLRAATAWMVRLDSDPTPDVRRAFEQWCAQDPDHAAAFDRLRSNHAVAGSVDLMAVGGDPDDLLADWPRRNAGSSRRPAYVFAGAMAALIAVIGVVLVLGSSRQAGAVQQRILLSTQIGEFRTVPLADGTQVTLDGTTTVNVVLGPESRDLELRQGRIRVQVAADLRPLYVIAGASRIALASGTVDVAVREGGTTVQLLPGAGRVELAREGRSQSALSLQPGQIMLIPPSGQEPSSMPSAPNDLQWPTGRLEFDRASLGAVIAEANRYTATPIQAESAEIAALQVSGVFRAGDAAGLARSLAAAFDLQVDQRPDAILLRSAAGRRVHRQE